MLFSSQLIPKFAHILNIKKDYRQIKLGAWGERNHARKIIIAAVTKCSRFIGSKKKRKANSV